MEESQTATTATGTQTQSPPSSAARVLEGDDDTDNEFDIPQQQDESQIKGGTTTLSTPEPLQPYSLPTVLQTVPYFHDTFSVLVYDPSTDKFIAHYSNNMRWISGCKKLITSFKILAHTLRTLYPERFTPNQPEFALAMSSADYPGVEYTNCIRAQRNDCIKTELSPILQFGSVFQRPGIFSTLLPMPMPQMNHLSCYHFYTLTSQVCEFYMERGPNNPNGLILPETLGLQFEDLIPQVVWRGTDFSYLHKMYPELRQPNFDMDIASQIDLSDRVDRKTSATHAIRQVYDELIPRWKGVVWSAEAERDAERRVANRNRTRNIRGRKQNDSTQQNQQREEQEDNGPPILPWCNIKFAGAMYMGVKTHTSEIEYYRQFEEYGIPAIGEGMSLETLGQYKYHIDLGGGGGTTWSGTLEKLGLPGLLFHHVTPTKDYFHDKLQPWVHYVPVKADLSDLKEKYDWAESHPLMAKRISDNATQFIRWLGTAQGMDEMFHQFYSWPLQRVVEAYVALEEGHDWREYMPDELRPIMQCDGFHDCEKLVHDIKFTVHDRDVDSSV